MCDEDVIKYEDIIPYEFILQEATCEYHYIIDSKRWEPDAVNEKSQDHNYPWNINTW